jgi:hypothetical protein
MKMLCRTESWGQSCNRCRTANVNCHYSEPGKPGRPPAKTGNAAAQRSMAEANTGGAVVSSPIHAVSENMTADDFTFWCQNVQPAPMTPEINKNINREQTWHWSQYDIIRGIMDTTPLQLDGTDRPPLLYPSSRAHGAEAWPTNILDSDQSLGQSRASSSELALTTYQNSNSIILELSEKISVGQDYIRDLAQFQISIARMIESDTPLSPEKLERGAARVLESSSRFLDLVEVFAGAAKSQDSSHIPDTIALTNSSPECLTIVVLQLFSISMRLIEMHHWLYSSINICLQQRLNTTQQGIAGHGDDSELQPLQISIAGVELTMPLPSWSRVLLTSGVYKLDCIQAALGVLKELSFVATVEGPTLLPIQTREELVEDQMAQMAKVHSAIAKLKASVGSQVAI